jgi:glutamine cyclotransferase
MLRRRQPLLLDRYWAALRRDRTAAPPAGLDPDLAAQSARLARAAGELDATSAFAARLRRQLQAQAEGVPAARVWPRPALDTRRRPTHEPTNLDDEETAMPQIDGTAEPVPIPLHERRWLKEALKIAAAAIVFGIVGALLALALRDDGDQPGSVPPTATATATTSAEPTSAPSTATVATSAPALRPTSTRPPPTPTLGTGGVIATRIPVGNGPSELAAGAGAIWVPLAGEGSVVRIDPATNTVVATIPIGEPLGSFGSPYNVATRGDQIWVADNGAGRFVRIDPATNQVVQTLAAPSLIVPPYDVLRFAVGDGTLWYLEATGDLVRLDAGTGEVVATIELADGTSQGFVAVTDTAIWVQAGISIHRVDPATNQIVATIPIPASGVAGLLVTDDAVWTASWMTGMVYRIDPATNEVVATIQAPGAHWLHFAATPGSVWIANNNFEPGDLGLIRIDTASNQVVDGLSGEFGSYIGITVGDGSLWLSGSPEAGPFEVVRIDPSS